MPLSKTPVTNRALCHRRSSNRPSMAKLATTNRGIVSPSQVMLSQNCLIQGKPASCAVSILLRNHISIGTSKFAGPSSVKEKPQAMVAAITISISRGNSRDGRAYIVNYSHKLHLIKIYYQSGINCYSRTENTIDSYLNKVQCSIIRFDSSISYCNCCRKQALI